MSELSVVDRRDWVEGPEAHTRYAGFEITQWAVPNRVGKTTVQDDYRPPPVGPARPVSMPVRPLEDTERGHPALSTHLADYKPWPLQPRAHVMVPPEGRGVGTFTGTSTHQDSFTAPPMPPRFQPWQKVQPPRIVKGSSNYASTYNTSYVPFPDSVPAPSMRPPALDQFTKGGRTGSSTYLHDFPRKPLNPKVEAVAEAQAQAQL